MGSDAHLHRMQPGCGRLFPSLLFPLPSVITETPQIRHLVSSPLNHHHEASTSPDMPRPRRNADARLAAAVYALVMQQVAEMHASVVSDA